MPSRGTLRKAKLTLSLIAIGLPMAVVSFWLQLHGGRKALIIVFLPLAAGMWMTIDLLHMAWTDIWMREDISTRQRWKLLLAIAFVTPIAGPIYWLLRQDEDGEAAP